MVKVAPGSPAFVRRSFSEGGSKCPPVLLLAFDRLEQRLEVALAEALGTLALDDLEEHRGTVQHRLREELPSRPSVRCPLPIGPARQWVFASRRSVPRSRRKVGPYIVGNAGNVILNFTASTRIATIVAPARQKLHTRSAPAELSITYAAAPAKQAVA